MPTTETELSLIAAVANIEFSGEPHGLEAPAPA